jgi:hypothetical protein
MHTSEQSVAASREALLRSALEANSFALACVLRADARAANLTDVHVSEGPVTAASLAAAFSDIKPRDDGASQPTITIPRLGIIIGAPKFVNAPGGVSVIDETNALMWSRTMLDEMTHADAEAACKALRLAGFDDWRLPARFELESLLDLSRHEPAINTDFFPDTASAYYWTSTPAAASPADCAWIVNFNHGHSGWYNRNNRTRVRAVRSVSRASQ